MRDRKRIKMILDLINQIWETDPNMRFLQLIYNLQSKYSAEVDSNGLVKSIEKDGYARMRFAFHYVEDDSFIQFLEDFIKNGGSSLADEQAGAILLVKGELSSQQSQIELRNWLESDEFPRFKECTEWKKHYDNLSFLKHLPFFGTPPLVRYEATVKNNG